MKTSINCRQNISLFFAIISIVVCTHFFYHYTNPEWVVYREAENAYLAENWLEAAQLYEKSFSLGLKYPVAMLKIARTYTEMKEYSKAKKWYLTYLKIKPYDIRAKKEYASTLTANGEFGKAAEIYQELLKNQSSQE